MISSRLFSLGFNGIRQPFIDLFLILGTCTGGRQGARVSTPGAIVSVRHATLVMISELQHSRQLPRSCPTSPSELTELESLRALTYAIDFNNSQGRCIKREFSSHTPGLFLQAEYFTAHLVHPSIVESSDAGRFMGCRSSKRPCFQAARVETR
ncbi:hypothetical protein MVEN_01747100 [Mycena venus]|uniref:Uncharacterized protein n=1 Tax=Mycena venus TaxID=2733690 RepID=A0A8H6XKZ3_9AGAR|nr:hypothetical protein MVEN_01747100 [Mycena venus]